MQCPKCAHKKMFDFSICPKCGYDLNAEYIVTNKDDKNNNGKSSNTFSIKNIFTVLIVLIAIIISTLSGASFFGITLTIFIVWFAGIILMKAVQLITKPSHMGRLKRITTKEGNVYFVDVKTGERVKTESDVIPSDIDDLSSKS